MSQYEKTEVAQEEELIDLSVLLYQFFKVLRRMIVLVIALTLVCAGGYWLIQRMNYVPQYTASTPFVVNSDSSGIVNEYSDALSAEELSKQFPQIINSSALQNRVMDALGDGLYSGDYHLGAGGVHQAGDAEGHRIRPPAGL